MVAAVNTAPTASFTIDPSSGDTDTNFAFDASASSDTETATDDLQVLWSVEGGNGDNGSFSYSWVTEKTASTYFIRYNSAIPSDYPMTYTVTLQVKDSEGLTGSLSKNIVVEAPVRPLAKCTVEPEEGYTWTKFTFDASESWDGQTANADLEFSWTFDYYDPEEGDGNGNNEFSTGWINSNTTSFSSYPSTGVWWISFSVRDEDGNAHWNFAGLDVNILPNTDPTASFTIDPGSGDTDTDFSFDASGSSDSESIADSLYVRWDFDNDGTFEVDWTKTKTTTHTYSSAATYTINMEVRDQGGLISSDTKTVVVEAIANTAPTASFTSGTDLEYINTSISFDASATSDAETASGDIEVRWDFDNDGTFEVDWTTSKTTNHSYVTEAIYTVKLEVKDEGGLISSATTSIQIESGTFTDSRDNQTYNTVIIGNQVWFAENLRYEISGKEITDNSTFQNNSAYDGWSYYDNDKATYAATYGILYQWEAAKIACPSGWKLPSDDEWKTLEMFIGMTQAQADGTTSSDRGDGFAQKLMSTSGWYENNGTDNYDFKALPGGSRSDAFYAYQGNFWSSSEYSSNSSNAWYRFLQWNNTRIGRSDGPKYYGQSVRCIKE